MPNNETMIVRVDDLLPRLAEAIVKYRKKPWSRAVAEAKIAPEMQGLDLRYETTKGEVQQVRLFNEDALWDDLLAIFMEMWTRYKQAGAEVWYKATFTLESGGKANLHFDYPEPGQNPLDLM